MKKEYNIGDYVTIAIAEDGYEPHEVKIINKFKAEFESYYRYYTEPANKDREDLWDAFTDDQIKRISTKENFLKEEKAYYERNISFHEKKLKELKEEYTKKFEK